MACTSYGGSSPHGLDTIKRIHPDLTALEDASHVISDADIASAAPEKRPWLRECQRQGKTVCSVITEAQLAQRLGIVVADGFRPSVPSAGAGMAALVPYGGLQSRLARGEHLERIAEDYQVPLHVIRSRIEVTRLSVLIKSATGQLPLLYPPSRRA
jgi:hypothetical protein